MAITNIQLSSSEIPDHKLSLVLDKLEVMPCRANYDEAMDSVLSWVSA